MRRVLMIILFLLSPSVLYAGEAAKVTWLTLENAMKSAKEEKKLVLIQFETTWCKYCKDMKTETYNDKTVIEKVNKMFKVTSVDKEGNKELVVKGKKMTEKEFASKFNINMTPMTYFLKPDGQQIKGYPGQMGPDEFLPILSYVGEGWYEKMSIIDYMKKLKKK